MIATRFLEKHYHKALDHLKRVEKAKHGHARRVAFEKVATKLLTLGEIERQIFYPACEKHTDLEDLVGVLLVELDVVKFVLSLASQALDRIDFDSRLKVLKGVVKRHAELEETDLFPRAEKVLRHALLKRLGADMQGRLEQDTKQKPVSGDLKAVLRDLSEPPTSPRKNPAK